MNRGLRIAVVVSVILTVLLYVVPYGQLVGWPLVLLSTLAHELGHGLTAVCVGGRFTRLEIYADASGVSVTSGVGGWRDAIVAAGGLLGPAIGAATAFAAGRTARGARVVLGLAAVLLVFVALMWVRNLFGFGFVTAVAVLLGTAARRFGPEVPRVVLVFLGVQLSLSVFSRSDYLFAASAHTAGGVMPSDVTRIAQAIGGPYWFWGAVCGLFSVIVLLGGLSVALGGKRGAALKKAR